MAIEQNLQVNQHEEGFNKLFYYFSVCILLMNYIVSIVISIQSAILILHAFSMHMYFKSPTYVVSITSDTLYTLAQVSIFFISYRAIRIKEKRTSLRNSALVVYSKQIGIISWCMCIAIGYLCGLYHIKWVNYIVLKLPIFHVMFALGLIQLYYVYGGCDFSLFLGNRLVVPQIMILLSLPACFIIRKLLELSQTA